MNRRANQRIDFDMAVKLALTDDDAWESLTSSPDGCRSVYTHLQTMLITCRNDFDRQKASAGLVHAEYVAGKVTKQHYNDSLERYHRWRISATRFRSMLQQRVDQLKDIQRSYGDTRKSDILASYRAAADSLVRAIFLHEAGEISDEELHTVLDTATLRFAVHGEMSIREAILRGFVAEHELQDHRRDTLMERISTEVPASAQHRGTKSHSPVPKTQR